MKQYWEWADENPTKSNPSTAGLYFYFLRLANELNWKNEFSISSTQVMGVLSVNYNTYKKYFDVLVESGLIKIVRQSKNQFSANIIALSNFNSARNKARNKASEKLVKKQDESSHDIHKTIDYKDCKDYKDILGEKKIDAPTKQKKNKEVLFRDSPYFDNPVLFMDEWSATKTAEQYPQIDPLVLYESIKLTTDATDKYRYANWMAAAQNWAKRDPKQYFARTGIEQFSRGTQELHRRNETLSKLAFDPITGRPWDE